MAHLLSYLMAIKSCVGAFEVLLLVLPSKIYIWERTQTLHTFLCNGTSNHWAQIWGLGVFAYLAAKFWINGFMNILLVSDFTFRPWKGQVTYLSINHGYFDYRKTCRPTSTLAWPRARIKVDPLDLFEPHPPQPSDKNPMFGPLCGQKWTFCQIGGGCRIAPPAPP